MKIKIWLKFGISDFENVYCGGVTPTLMYNGIGTMFKWKFLP